MLRPEVKTIQLRPRFNDNIKAIEGLNPQSLWRIFAGINEQPRDSKKEVKALNAIKEWADDFGFKCNEDGVGNLCIHVPANGSEIAAPILIQNHIDMVCVKKPDSLHDFENDPILLRRDGDTLTAKDTSLGADNLIGLSAIMAISEDPEAIHPEMHLLITRDEEGDFTGASGIDLNVLKITGITSVLNLDTESQSTLTSASAGYRDLEAVRHVQREAINENSGIFYELRLSGLAGGHSGTETGLDRGNANLALAQILERLTALGVEFITFYGGEASNSLSSSAKAHIFVPKNVDLAVIHSILDQELAKLKSKLKDSVGQPNEGIQLEIALSESEIIRAMGGLAKKYREDFFAVLRNVPDGVLERNQAPLTLGQTESSINLGTMEVNGTRARLLYCARSYDDAKTDSIVAEAESTLKTKGFETKITGSGSSWVGDPDSRLSRAILSSFEAVDGHSGKVERVHGGLELGVIVEKIRTSLGEHGQSAKIESASFGVDVQDQHTFNERVSISKVEVFYRHLQEVLKRLA